MDINITGRNIELDEALKTYIHKRIDKLEKLYRRIYKCEVILEEEKIRQNAEIIMYLKRSKIVAKESSPDIYASIDNASENIKKQLRRLKDRVSTRRRRVVLGRIMSPVARMRAEEEEVIVVPEERGEIVDEDRIPAKPMSPEEARLELELANNIFMAFKNAETGQINVIYRKNDGNYGLIEPKF